jgi:hypothetical protein
MKYKILDTDEIVTEKDLRELLYRYEIQDLLDNTEEYFKGHLNLDSQFKCIDKAINGTTEEIIDMLGTNWNVPISEPFI